MADGLPDTESCWPLAATAQKHSKPPPKTACRTPPLNNPVILIYDLTCCRLLLDATRDRVRHDAGGRCDHTGRRGRVETIAQRQTGLVELRDSGDHVDRGRPEGLEA